MATLSETSLLDAAAAKLHTLFEGNVPRTCVVLGSGLKDFATQLVDARELAFRDVPGLPAPRVAGHGGAVIHGAVDGVPVACLSGRVHLYEGWTAAEVVRAVRSLRHAGVERFFLTNAAGGLHPEWQPGALMVVRDHLNMTGTSPLLGDNEPALGPRFPDQSAIYSPELRKELHRIDDQLLEGVYAGLLGPSYETPAEVRMLQTLGADAVGMSTVLEAQAVHAMGAQVVALSLISNPAAGLAEGALNHEEVLAAGQGAAERMSALVTAFLRTA